MTETMIRMHLDALIAAAQSNDDKKALIHGLAIAGQVLVDFNRIANALETLAGRK
jgi:hypothetical protein